MKNRSNKLKVVILSLLAGITIIIMTACTSTVIPKPVVDNVPSFDGNSQTSGVLSNAPNGSLIISESARARYNAMVEQYGNRFIPPLVKDAGVQPWTVPGQYTIDKEHDADARTMNRWRKSGVK
jgi:hypothetical protein